MQNILRENVKSMTMQRQQNGRNNGAGAEPEDRNTPPEKVKRHRSGSLSDNYD